MAVEEGATPEEKGKDAQAKRERVDSLWRPVLSGKMLPGMTIGRSDMPDDEGAADWRRTLPSATIRADVDEDRSLPGATLDDEAATGASLAGATLDDEGKKGVSLAGPTFDEGPEPGDSLKGATLEERSEGEAAEGPTARPDDFSIEGKLASGGMGDVFVARQLGLDRVVALKRPRKELRSASGKLGVFVREGTVTGDLEHPNIVPIYQNGVDDGGLPYYAMKLIRGIEWRYLLHPELAKERDDPELEKMVAERAASMNLPDHLDVLLKVCDAVAFAHSRHILHRDLKPENVMVGGFGEVQVMDWGLAIDVRGDPPKGGKAVSRRSIRGPAGTPAYMAPEMALGETDKIGVRTDVYLLGAILYELLTGRPPHDAKGLEQVLYQAALNKVTPPSSSNPQIAQELSSIAMHALETDPSGRPEAVSAFQAELREYLTHAQSLQITRKAESALSELEAGKAAATTEAAASTRYVRYAEVVASFRQALELWAENSDARTGIERGLVSFIEAAMSGGDLGLANAQLRELRAIAGESDPRTIRLQERWNGLDRARRARKRNLRLAVGSAVVLLLILVVGGLYSYREIMAERDRAEGNFEEAQEQKAKAEENLVLANQQREEAEKQRKMAEENLSEASRQKKEADRQKSKAEENFSEANRQRQEAEKQRSEADTQRKKAEDNLAEANRRKREALRNLARVDIQRAESRVESDRDYPQAALYVLRAIGTMGDIDTTEPRRLLAQLLQASPQLKETVELPRTGKAVLLAGGLRVLLDDARVWGRGVIEPRTASPVSGAKTFVRWNGRWVVSDRTGKLYENGKPFRLPGVSKDPVSCLGADAAGEKLGIGTFDGRLLVFEAQEREAASLSTVAHRGGVTGVAFQPNSTKVLTAGSDGRLRVWDLRDGGRRAQVRAHVGFVSCLAVNKDGSLIATAGAEGVVRVWDAGALSELVSLVGHEREVGAVAFHPTRSWLASQSWDGTVRLWDWSIAADPKVATLHVENSANTLSLAFSDDGTLLACLAGNRELQLWDLSERSDVTPPAWERAAVPGARLLGSIAGNVILSGPKSTHVLPDKGSPTRRVERARVLAIAKGGAKKDRWMAAREDGTLSWWPKGRPFAEVGTRIVAAARQGDFLVLAGADGNVLLVRTDTDAPRAESAGKLRQAAGVAVSGDGLHVAAWDGSGTLLVGAPGRLQKLAPSGAPDIQQAVWREDPAALIVRNNTSELLVLDTGSGRVVKRLAGHSAAVRAVALGSSGRWMATGGADGQVRAWDLRDHSSTVLVSGLGQWVEDVVIDEDSGRVACVLEDSSVRQFRLPEPDVTSDVAALRRQIKARLGIERLPEAEPRTASAQTLRETQ